MVSKSDKRGEGLGDLNLILGHAPTKFQQKKDLDTEEGNQYSDDDFEDLDLEQLADENYLNKRKEQLKMQFQDLTKKAVK